LAKTPLADADLEALDVVLGALGESDGPDNDESPVVLLVKNAFDPSNS